MRALGPAAAFFLATVLVAAVASPAEPVGPDEPTYEFLLRHGSLLFEYGKFDESAVALEQACALPEGRDDPSCHERLATAAERAGRIGVAMSAWEARAALGAGEVAVRELHRLRSAWGRVVLRVPAGRHLPSLPVGIEHQGFLIDPQIKRILAATVDAAAGSGIATDELWLPAGPYRLGALEIEVPADGVVELALPRTFVPHRPVAFSLRGGPGRGVTGPTELALLISVRAGGVPTAVLGAGPMGVAAQVAVARRAGPVRFSAGARLGTVPVRSLSPEPNRDRRAFTMEILADLDVGIDLAAHPRLILTPHAGVVAGRLGAPLVPCVAVAPTSGAVHRGECRLTAVGMGGVAGMDATLALGPEPSRILARAGVAAEVLGAGFVAAPGDTVRAESAFELVRAETWRFARVGALIEVGVALRF